MASIASTPLKEATRYTLIRTGHDFSVALKMESEKVASLFLRFDKTSNIRSSGSSADLHDFKNFAAGDTLLVGFITQLPRGAHEPFTAETLRWTVKCPKPEAVASMALVCGLMPRRKNLAFVAESLNSSNAGQAPYVRIYDPMTLTTTCLPADDHLHVFPGDPVRVTYTVLPPGALQPHTGSYTVPHEAPYPKAGAAVMQCLVSAEQELGNKKLAPDLGSQDGEEVVLSADYYPFGKNKIARKIDMARAARIFRSGQQLQVAPETGPREPRMQFVLAPIRFSKVHDDRISFTFAIPEHAADRIWKEQWQMILQRSFLFKPSTNQVLQRHFHRKLKEGALREILLSDESKPVQQIIQALFGDVNAIAKPDINVTQPHQTPAGNMLSMEQTCGLEYAMRALLSTRQAAAGSGKTTTTTTITIEQTSPSHHRRNSCTAMLAPMNVAIDNSSTHLAKQLKKVKRRAIVFQAATFLSSRSADDKYHKFRLPYLLVKLGEGKWGQLTDEEAAVVKSANLIASRRYRGLRGMDWSSVLHGEVKMEDRSDFVDAVKILLAKYKPEIVLGTMSNLLSFADYLAPYVTDIVIDEAGTAAVLDVACLLTSWTNTRTLTMVGDIHQLPNFTAPLPEDKRKFGFESAVHCAAMHPNAPSTRLTEVFRSHPLIVRVLSAFAYGRDGQDGELKTKVKAKERKRGKHKSTAAMSYTNDEQARLAYAIYQQLEDQLPGARVRCLALYSGARDQLNEGFSERGIELSAKTVDGAQGQECDVTILETAYQPDEQHKSKFMDKRERLTVAISRSRDGLVIIGDVDALEQLEEWKILFAIIRRVCPGAFVETPDVLRITHTPSTELALSLQSLGLPSHPSPRPSTSGNDQTPTFSKLPAASQSALLKEIVASGEHRYDMSDFEQMYAEVKRSRGEAQLDGAAIPQAPLAKRKPVPGQQHLEAIATLVPGIVLPHPRSTASVEAIEGRQDDQMDYQDAHSTVEQPDPITQPGGIRRVIDAESDEEFLYPTINVVIDEEPDASDSETDIQAQQALAQQMQAELSQDLAADADISRRISELQGPSSGSLTAVNLQASGVRVADVEMDTEAMERGHQALEPTSPPSSSDTIEQLSPLTREGRADSARQAREEAERFLPLDTQTQDAMWRAKDAPATLPPIPKKKPDESRKKPDPTLSVAQEDEPEQLISQERCLPAHTMKKEPEYKTPAQLLRIPKLEPVDPDWSKDATAGKVSTPMEVDGIPDNQPTSTYSTGQKASEKAAQIAAPNVVDANDKKAKPQAFVEKATKEKPTVTSAAAAKPAKHQPASSKKTSGEDRESRPKKNAIKPTTEAPNGSTKSQTKSQKMSRPDSNLPKCMEDLFGSDSDQSPAPKKTSTSKKEDATKPQTKKKQASDQQPKPKGTPAKQQRNWEFPASAKAIQEMLMFGPKPKFSGVLERESWKTAGGKALEAAEKLKAQKKADGLEVSSSDTEEEEVEREERLPTHHRLLFKLKNPEKYKELKEAEDKRAAVAANALKAKPRNDLQKPEESVIDIIEPQLRAQEPPRRSQRSVSRERSVEPKKTLIGPVNPPMPSNLEEKKKTKPSAGAFKQPRDRSVPQ